MNKNFIDPTGSAVYRQAIDKHWFKYTDLLLHLTKSLWNIELEHALERFSIRAYLDWFDEHHFIDWDMDDEFPERFLNYLKDKVSNSLQLNQVSASASHSGKI